MQKRLGYINIVLAALLLAFNYYVFHIGKIKNVPLTSTYTIFPYTGATVQYEREVTKATEKSIASSTSKAVSTSVNTVINEGVDVGLGISAKVSKIINANVELGWSYSVTQDTTTNSVWESTYSECLTVSESETNKISLAFDESCEKGNYLYLYLGNLNVYYAVIQSREDPEKYHVQTYSDIYSYKYVLNYTGNDDEFPIDEERTIEMDTSFIKNLQAPTNYIKSTSPILFENNLKQSDYFENAVTVKPLGGHWWSVKIDNYDELLAKGYNKIRIDYKFRTEGGWSVFGGNVNIIGDISSSSKTDNSIYHFSKASDTDGKWIEVGVTGDLQYFKSEQKVYLILNNENFTESFNISHMTVNITVYYEE